MLRSKGSTKRTIAITMGDPCGVGPEVIAAAMGGYKTFPGIEFCIIGNEEVLQKYWHSKKAMPDVIHVEDAPGVIHIPGHPTPMSGKDSLLYLKHALHLLKQKKIDALVTGPVSKEAVIPFHPGFKGHTTYLAKAFGLNNVEMLFVAKNLKVVLVTRHIPLKDVPGRITSKKVMSVVETTVPFISNYFKVKHPKVAVCGLNPHAGEGGHMGKEEILQITPALNALRCKGLSIAGPLPADTLFEPKILAQYDLIVSMYHDQALTALKAKYFNELVNITVGLPFIRTSPAHGTAFGIAGKKLADAGSMTAAIKLAAELA